MATDVEVSAEREVLPEVLMNSVLGKLYDILTNGDEVAPPSKDNYLSWLSVGIPYPEEELEFLSDGFRGVYRKPEEAPLAEGEEREPPEEMTPEQIQELRADDTTRKYMQAENLSRLLDAIPDAGNVSGGVTMNVWNPENTLSQAYRHILKFSQVADFQPDEKTKAKIVRLRGLLQEKKIKTNIVTEEEEEVLEETALVKKYNEKLQKYLNEALEYNTHRINALAARDSAAVHYWTINASILRSKVMAAKNDWITNGFKEEYDQIAAFIAQVEGRSMPMLKEQYKDDLEKARLTGPASGSDFYYSSLIPAGFHKSNNGWTKFEFSNSDFKSNYKFEKKKGSAGARAGFFGIGARAAASHEERKIERTIDTSSFKLTFSICQVMINRPWFNVNFLTSKYWRFAENNPEFKDNMVSDGASPPEGMIPAFSTTAIFIRDLVLTFSESNSELVDEMSSSEGDFRIGWGPFSVNGSYENNKQERNIECNRNGQSIEVVGMQLIGFKCHMLPKSPDARPDVEEWV